MYASVGDVISMFRTDRAISALQKAIAGGEDEEESHAFNINYAFEIWVSVRLPINSLAIDY